MEYRALRRDGRSRVLVGAGHRAKPRCLTLRSWSSRWIPVGEISILLLRVVGVDNAGAGDCYTVSRTVASS